MEEVSRARAWRWVSRAARAAVRAVWRWVVRVRRARIWGEWGRGRRRGVDVVGGGFEVVGVVEFWGDGGRVVWD